MDYSELYNKLASLLVEVIESQQGEKLKRDQHLYYAESLAVKMFRHLASMRQLADGLTVTFPRTKFSHVDHSSVMLLARASVETYLTFFYVFIDPATENQQKFRFKAWMLAGLMDRQKIHTNTKEGNEVKKSEARMIKALKNDLPNFDSFIKLDEKERKMILNGNWRMRNSWGNLATVAGFNDTYFKNIYGYMCGYAHSSYISVLQVSQAKSIDEQIKLSNIMLSVGVVLMSHFIFSYASLFKNAEIALDNNPEIKKLAETWRLGEDDMRHIYDK